MKTLSPFRLALAALALLFASCATDRDGVPRNLKYVLNAPVPGAIEAVNRAFDAMRYTKTGQVRIPASGSRPEVRRLLANDTAGRNVVVILTPYGPHKTEISIRVGKGDLAASHSILSQVRRRI